jgi:hypothetical protein
VLGVVAASQVVALAPSALARIAGGEGKAGAELGPAVPALVVTAIHFAALTMLVSRVVTPLGLRALLLVSLSWLIPSLLAGGGSGLEVFAPGLDAAAHLARHGAWVETPSVALVDTAPVGAAALAAWLLHPPSPARQ